MKTNKSFTKRIKVTKSGKALVRKPNKNHFKAKKSREDQLKNKQFSEFIIDNKTASRFLPRTNVNNNHA